MASAAVHTICNNICFRFWRVGIPLSQCMALLAHAQQERGHWLQAWLT